MNREAIKILNAILNSIPIIGIDSPMGSFCISDLTEENNKPHTYDYEITNFLLKGEFAILMRGPNMFSRFEESRFLELTVKGAELSEAGSYEDYIGIGLTILIKVFKIDAYGKWAILPKEKKEKIIAWRIGIIVGIIVGIIIAILIELIKPHL